jgi:hypothetical protein
MKREARRASRLLPRLLRLVIGRNELRRRSDRIEGIVLAALSAGILAIAVTAALYGVHTYQSQRAAVGRLRPVTAVLSQAGPAVRNPFDPAAPTLATWRPPHAAERSGPLTIWNAPAIFDAPAGTAVTVWLDRSGWPQAPPPGPGDTVINALVESVAATGSAALALVFCYFLFRRALDRRRLARWEAAWAITGPRWTSRR